MRDRPWTKDDVAELRRLAPSYPASEVAIRLGRRLLDTGLKAHDLRISLRIKSRPGPSRNAPKRRSARRKARVGTPAGPFSFWEMGVNVRNGLSHSRLGTFPIFFGFKP